MFITQVRRTTSRLVGTAATVAAATVLALPASAMAIDGGKVYQRAGVFTGPSTSSKLGNRLITVKHRGECVTTNSPRRAQRGSDRRWYTQVRLPNSRHKVGWMLSDRLYFGTTSCSR